MSIVTETQTTQQPSIGTVYRAALADTIHQARATLPSLLHSRLDRAAALVHRGAVTLHSDGTASVSSESVAGKLYHVQAGECQCQDFQHRAPQRLCKHVLSRHLAK